MILKRSALFLLATLFLAPHSRSLAGSLSGNFTNIQPGSVISLSDVGNLDWAKWGYDPTNVFVHKNGANLISDLTLIGSNTPVQYNTNLHGYSWTNGVPVAAATNSTTGLLVTGLTNGFLILAPADTTIRRLKVFLGVNGAQGTLDARLSDNSASGYNDSSVDAGLSTTNAVYFFNYSADSAGQTLAIQFTVSALYDPAGSVTLQAATLATNVPPAISFTQPTNNQSISSEGNIPLQVAVSDSDGTLALVEYFQNGNKIGDTNLPPFSITWSNVASGSYSLTAVATDNDGAKTTSLPVNIGVATNFPPTVTIISPVGDDNFTPPTNVVITANAADVDGSVTNVKFLVDGVVIGSTTTPSYTISWTNVTAGVHDLTAQAADNRGATTLSTPITVYVTTNGGSLTGSFALSSGETINLTEQGTNDWAQWGLFTQNSFNHKAGVVSRISTFTPVASDPSEYFPFADNASGYSWYDGTPFASVTNSPSGVYVVGLGKGFDLTITARTNTRTLKIYCGTFGARGKLLAYLNDFSSRIYVDSSLDNFGNGPNAVYTLTYAAATNNRSLRVRYITSESHTFFGNVTLQAATLCTGDAPPFVALTNPANNSVYSAPATLNLGANAFDTDGTVTNVEFFQGTNKLGQAIVPPYTLIWTNVPAGSYSLTARATDNQGETFISNPVNVFVIGSGGYLRAGLDTADPAVNLTTEGVTDWGHWGVDYIGHGPPGLFNHKRNVPQQVSDATKVGSSDWLIFTDNPSTYSWIDGTPTLATNTTSGIYKNNLGEGFLFSIPATTNLQRVKVYVGAYAAQGKLEASLSDSSAPPFVDTSVASLGSTSAVYSVVFSATGTGKKLNIKYTSNTLFDESYGNVTLQAASLASALPVLSLVNPQTPGTFGFSFHGDHNISYLIQSTANPPNWQTLTNITGTGSEAIYTEPTDSNRVFRVKLGL